MSSHLLRKSRRKNLLPKEVQQNEEAKNSGKCGLIKQMIMLQSEVC
jgi:hypothetical protein